MRYERFSVAREIPGAAGHSGYNQWNGAQDLLDSVHRAWTSGRFCPADLVGAGRHYSSGLLVMVGRLPQRLVRITLGLRDKSIRQIDDAVNTRSVPPPSLLSYGCWRGRMLA